MCSSFNPQRSKQKNFQRKQFLQCETLKTPSTKTFYKMSRVKCAIKQNDTNYRIFYLLILNTQHVTTLPLKYAWSDSNTGPSPQHHRSLVSGVTLFQWKARMYIKTQSTGQRDGSVGKVQATKAWGPEFRAPASMLKSRRGMEGVHHHNPVRGSWRQKDPRGLLACQSQLRFSERPVSKSKVERDWRLHPPLTFSQLTHTHTHDNGLDRQMSVV